MPYLPFLLFASLIFAASPAKARDNFIIFIADDLGVDGIAQYSDDTAYGHPGEGAAAVVTPNIDTLAEDGVLFRNAYTNSSCAPTRAQLLTGRHALRTGIGTPGGSDLDLSEQTLPELLSASHLNAAIGKWHVGPNGDADHPVQSGFDYFAGSLPAGLDDYYAWEKFVNDTSLNETVSDPHNVYATDDVSAEAIAKIAEFGDDEFLLWVAFNAPHSPFHVPTGPLATSVNNGSSNRTKYVAAIEAMDREIKDILDSMSPAVRADTTIIFIGDNGTPGGVTEPPFDSSHAKATSYEGGVNVPLIVVSPHIDPTDEGSESLALVQSVDLFTTIAEIAGVPSAAEDSISILPYLQDPDLSTRPLRPYAYAEEFNPNGSGIVYANHERGITDGTYKLIWRNGTVEEFFDLTTHPFEDSNLLPYETMSEETQAAYDVLVSQMEGVEISGDVACPSLSDLGCTTGYLKAALDWRTKDGDGDKMKVKLQKGPALLQTDYGDPVIADGSGYSLCVYDDLDELVVETRIVRGGQLCSGKECWQTIGGDVPDGKGYKFRDKLGSSTGIVKAQLRDGDPEKSKWKIAGKGLDLPDGVPDALLTSAHATVQLRGTELANCLSATVADIVKQETDRFKAKE